MAINLFYKLLLALRGSGRENVNGVDMNHLSDHILRDIGMARHQDKVFPREEMAAVWTRRRSRDNERGGVPNSAVPLGPPL